jgi:hypothetical protein
MSMHAGEEVRYLLRTLVDEGRSLVRVQQQHRRDDVLTKVAVVTDDVQKYEQTFAGQPVQRPDVADALIAFERRYRAIETSLPQDDVLVMWIQGELSGRISDFVKTTGLVSSARDDG